MLDKLFGSKVKVRILSEIGKRPYKEFYLNELSKTLKIGLGRTKDILDELASFKILNKRRSGNRILFKLNENNNLSFEVVKFANMNALMKLDERFRVAITNFSRAYEITLKENLLSIVVFGSVAKSRATKYSDIDILVIVRQKLGKNIKEELHKVFLDILDIFAKIAEEKIFTEEEFIKNYQTGDDFLINVMRDGIVVFDRNNFYTKFLFRELPKVTKVTIENKLRLVREWLEPSFEIYKKHPEGVAPELGIISNHLSRALLLLNNILPQSKHDIPNQLKTAGEHKLAGVYKKTRGWFDNPPLEVNKEEIWELLTFLKEKHSECSRRLEGWT